MHAGAGRAGCIEDLLSQIKLQNLVFHGTSLAYFTQHYMDELGGCAAPEWLEGLRNTSAECDVMLQKQRLG